jgi:16S rRNA (adenine1518-N6/adenine1519-N6)-dimethyltransferase
MIDPNLARAVASEAMVGPGDRVLEIGAGMGSLTVALAATGAEVLAVEFDKKMIPALQEVVAGLANVRVLQADAMTLDWSSALDSREWVVCANLPYNVAVPITMSLLERAPMVRRLVITVQLEVGQRLTSPPGGGIYGAVSVRVAYFAEAFLVRRLPPDVFWPRPKVESALVRMERRKTPPVGVDPIELFAVVEAGFAQRRKTMRSALRRMGASADEAVALLAGCGLDPDVRAEQLGLEGFACLAEGMRR